MHYAVTVYEPTEFDDSKRGPTLEFISESTTVEADDPRTAAVAGWLDLVGKVRKAKLAELGDPAKISDGLHDPNALAAAFRESSIPVPDDRHCYIYDNEVETWLITVEES
jgi:hypothetical protein